MRILAIVLAVLISGCVSQPMPERPIADLPDGAAIERPNDPVAAAMLDDYLIQIRENLPVIEAIALLGARDQYVRRKMNDRTNDPELDPDVREAFRAASGAYMRQVDLANTSALKSLLEEITWRELAEYDEIIFINAFMIVQHTEDHDFQAEVLREVAPLAEEGLVQGQLYAVMYDRVELRETGSQLYGTQLECIDDQYDIVGLRDPETIDARRLAMKMQPLAEYVEFVRGVSGPCKSAD